jgi:hypothetical protein
MSRVLAAIAVVSAVAAVPAAARAQPSATAPAAVDRAWALYDHAFERLAAGDRDAAAAELAELVRRFPDHPAAARARELALAGDAVGAARTHGEQPTRLARAELGFWMTIHGVLAGLEVRELADLEGSRPTAAALMIGGAVGLGASLYASRGGITPGTALLLDSAITWGAWNSLAVVNDFPEDQTGAAVSLGAQAVGLGAGLVLSQSWHPRAGDVALANTTGFWVSILTLLGHGVVDTEPEVRTIVLAGDAGLVAGALLSQAYPMSRGRTLLIDTGGVLGFLTGALVSALADTDSAPATLTPMLLGTAGGLAAATQLTADWDAPELPGGAHIGLGPVGDSGGFGAFAAGRW